MTRRSHLRASDADRELVAERLRRATAEGRLLAEELEQRLGDALSARTYGELDALVADLPDRIARGRHDRPTWLRPALALAIAIPLALMIVAALAIVLTGMLTGWVLWVALAWWFAGHRHPACGAHRAHSLHGYGRWRGNPQPGRGSWS